MSKPAKSLILFCLALLFALLLAELVVRIVFPLKVYEHEVTSTKYLFFDCDQELAWRGKKSISDVFRRKYFEVKVSHDQYGQRNTNPPLIPDHKNIWLLGDSFAWGWGVEDQHTLQSVLNQNQQAINYYVLAAPGYGQAQQFLLLKNMLAELGEKPDEVILLITRNDFEDNTVGFYRKPLYKDKALTMPSYTVDENSKLIFKPKLQDCQRFQQGIDNMPAEKESISFLENFHFYNLASAVIYNSIMSGMGVNTVQGPNEQDHLVMVLLLEEFGEFLKQRGITLKIAYLDFGHDDSYKKLQAALEKKNIDVVLINGKHFYAKPGLIIPFDGHFTAKGNILLATKLSEALSL